MTKVFWLFGRSAAGKTTLAKKMRGTLLQMELPVMCLDGDDLRSGLNSDLGFSPKARLENHRRIAEVANFLAEQGFNVIVSTMAPEYAQRDIVAKILGDRLTWFYIHAPLQVCIQRDPKGLYRKATEGKVGQLIDYPFDLPRPHEAQITIDTQTQSIDACHQIILDVIAEHLSDFSI